MISPDNFPLPDKLASKLRAASATLHDGRGFAVLRGLKPDKLSNEDSAIAFCGIGSYIGINRAASENGIGMCKYLSNIGPGTYLISIHTLLMIHSPS